MEPEPRTGFPEVERLRAELARSERMRRALTEVILTVGSNLGLEALLERVCSIIDEAYESISSLVYLWDPEIERLVVWVARFPSWWPETAMFNELGREGPGPVARFIRGRVNYPLLYQIQLRLGEGLTGWVAQHREPVLIGRELCKDPRWKLYPGFSEEVLESLLAVPILRPNGERLGVIALCSTRSDHFTPEQLHLLTEITGLLATVIEKIRLDEELARRAKVLSFLGQLCGRLSSARPLEELMDSAATLTAQVLASDACMIVTVDRSEGRFVLRGLAPSRSEAFLEIDGRLGALIDTDTNVASNEQLFRDLALALPERFAEANSAPLLAGADHLGFITCYRHQRYSSADRELLSVIAGQVALGLIAFERTVDPAERDVAGELFGLLATGRGEPTVASLAASLGLDLHRPHVLLQARLLPAAGSEPAGVVADRFARAGKQFVRTVEQQHPHSLLRESGGGVTGLVRMAKLSDGATLQQRLQAAADDVASRLGISISAGLSSACRGPREYADAYREAAEALEIGSKLRGEGRIVRFEELGPDLYLFRMAADPRTRRDPWMRTLVPLIDYDRRKGSELLATLDAYLEGRGNASVTAAQLSVHRNTLRQRLTKIESLAGISLAETHDWLPLHFAVKLARMQEGDRR
jgi:GAF domain-containing protein